MEHNHLMELLGAFLTGVVGPIFYLIVSKHLQKEKDKKRDIVKENISSVSLISDELEEIREEFKGDRVWIAQISSLTSITPNGKTDAPWAAFRLICWVLSANPASRRMGSPHHARLSTTFGGFACRF